MKYNVLNFKITVPYSVPFPCQFVWLIAVQSRPINLEIIPLSLKGLMTEGES